MTTSIRDLLYQVRVTQQLAQRRPKDPGLAHQARQVIGAAAPPLRRLQDHWRPDWNPDKPAHQLLTHLADACAEIHAGNGPLSSRSAQLLAVAGDAVGTLCGQANLAGDRWSVGVALADIVRQGANAYRLHGPDVADRVVERARQAAMAILRAGRRYVPAASTGMLDLAITPPLEVLTDPLTRAAAAAAEIDRTLALTALDHHRPTICLYELRSVALAFHTATRILGPHPDTATPATQAWDQVRQLSRRMCDGAEPAPDGPERLVRACAQLHDNLHRWMQDGTGSTDPATTLTAQEILAHAASSARNLADQAHRLAGRVYGRAHEYPAQEARVTEILHGKAVILDTEDLIALVDALLSAETISADMITTGTGVSAGLGDYPLLGIEQPWVAASPSIDPPSI